MSLANERIVVSLIHSQTSSPNSGILPSSWLSSVVPVGTRLTPRPPARSRRALLTHRAPPAASTLRSRRPSCISDCSLTLFRRPPWPTPLRSEQAANASGELLRRLREQGS